MSQGVTIKGKTADGRNVEVRVDNDGYLILGGSGGGLTDDELRASPVVVRESGVTSTVNATDDPLGVGGTFVGEWEDVTNYDYLELTIFTDVDSEVNGALLALSMDGGTTTHKYIPQTILGGYGAFTFVVPVTSFNAYKIIYTNGGVAQTVFKTRIEMKTGANPIPLAPLGAVLNPTLSGAVVRLSSDTYQSDGDTATSSGDNSIIIPDASKRIRLYYIMLNADGSNTTDVTVTVKFGAGGDPKYKLSLRKGAIFARNIGAGRRYIEGGVGEALVFSLSTAVNGLHWSVEYEQV